MNGLTFKILLAIVFFYITNINVKLYYAYTLFFPVIVFYLVTLFSAVNSKESNICYLLYTFYMIFGILIPANHYLSDSRLPWDFGYHQYNNLTVIISLLIMILSHAIVTTFYFRQKTKVSKGEFTFDIFPVERRAYYISSILFLILATLLILYIGKDFLFMKRVQINLFYEDTKEFSIYRRVSGLVIVSLLFSSILLKASIKNKCVSYKEVSLFLVSLLFTLIIVNPINSARWKILAYALMIAIVFVDFRRVREKILMVTSLVFSMNYLYPLANYLSRDILSDHVSQIDMYSKGDFDGFQSLLSTVVYVKEHGIEPLNVIIVIFTNFIPRSIWPNKPENSSTVIGEYFDAINSNLSMPIVSEFYYDFSFVGVILYSCALSILMKKVDERVSSSSSSSSSSSLGYAISVIISSNLIFISRGSLLGTLELISVMIILVLISRFFSFRFK